MLLIAHSRAFCVASANGLVDDRPLNIVFICHTFAGFHSVYKAYNNRINKNIKYRLLANNQ